MGASGLNRLALNSFAADVGFAGVGSLTRAVRIDTRRSRHGSATAEPDFVGWMGGAGLEPATPCL
jgi:hypothetical protein